MKYALFKEYRNIRTFVKLYYPVLKDFIGKRHLDIGCGYGTIPFLIACCWPKTKVIGIDIDKDAIKWAKKRYKLPNLSFKVCEISKIRKRFDSISCFNVLHHVAREGRREDFLKTVKRKLKKNGHFILRDFLKEDKEKYRKLFKELMNERRKWNLPLKRSFDNYYISHCLFSEKEIREVLKKYFDKVIFLKRDVWFIYVGKK